MTQWRTARLEDVAQVLGGGTPSRTEKSYFGGGIAWATPTDITKLDQLYISETKETVSETGLRSSSTKLMPAGAVLLTSRATIGFTAVSTGPICTNQGFINFICGPDLVPEYLAYWLRTQRDKMIQHAGGTTFKEIARGVLRKFDIPVPALAEQRRIVDILSRAEGIVRLRHEAEKKAAELIPALFLDMFGDPATNPKGWPKSVVGEISTRVTKGESPKWQGFEYGNVGIRFVTSENVLWGSVDLEKEKYVPDEFHKKLKRSSLEARDLLINLVGASVGRAALVPEEALPANINQAVAVTTLDQKKCIPEFLLAHVLLNSTQQKLLGNVVEAARANISLANIRELQVMLPPLNTQVSFSERVAQIRSIEFQQSAATATAQATFDALLAQVFHK